MPDQIECRICPNCRRNGAQFNANKTKPCKQQGWCRDCSAAYSKYYYHNVTKPRYQQMREALRA